MCIVRIAQYPRGDVEKPRRYEKRSADGLDPEENLSESRHDASTFENTRIAR
jgi:hypothetical protein